MSSETTTIKDFLEAPEKNSTEEQWSPVIQIENLSRWKIETVLGVLRLSNLQEDWDSYGSPPPYEEVINASLNLIQSIDIEYLPIPHVSPVVGGGIQFEWNVNSRGLELEMLPNGSIEYLKCERGRPAQEGELNLPVHESQNLLNWLTSE